jgi:indolepyruvate ferredoxin oxidoreductase
LRRLDGKGINEALMRSIRVRVVDLIGYQSAAYATQYVDRVATTADAESAMAGPGASLAITDAVARNLYKLMAYKDEYEVARLLIQKTFSDRVQAMFTGPVRMVLNLQPPFLRWFGLNKKVGLGPWVRPFLSALASLKFLRGSIADPFGYLKVRREERALLSWYLGLLDELLPQLNVDNANVTLELFCLPADIRGYENVKSKSIEEAKGKEGRLRGELKGAKRPRVIPMVVA